MILKILGALAALFILLVIWLITGVSRGARKRDERLLASIAPIGRRLDAGETVTQEEIAAVSARPEIRHMLYAALRLAKKPELIPALYFSSVDQGASALAYWMMHPNELKDAPEKIELVETLKRSVNGREADFHVYRYRMPDGHWAGNDGWLLGLAGPMFSETEPYAEMPGAFSRVSDVEGKVTPAELVDWYVGMLRQKGQIT